MMNAYKHLALDMGAEERNVMLLEEGDILELDPVSAKIAGRIEVENIMVDGLGVGDVGNVVLRDRKLLSEEGLLIIIVNLDKSGRLAADPDVVSRGFVYAKENEKIINDIADRVKSVLNEKQGRIDWHYAKTKINDEIEKFVFNETQRRPMILPLVVEV